MRITLLFFLVLVAYFFVNTTVLACDLASQGSMGITTKPFPSGHGVSVYRNASLIHEGGRGSSHTIAFDAWSFDTDGYYNGVHIDGHTGVYVLDNRRIHIPSGLGGLYCLGCRVTMIHPLESAKGDFRGVGLWINNKYVANMFTPVNVLGDNAVAVYKSFVLHAGDSIECRAYQDTGADMPFISGPSHMYMEAILVGAVA